MVVLWFSPTCATHPQTPHLRFRLSTGRASSNFCDARTPASALMIRAETDTGVWLERECHSSGAAFNERSVAPLQRPGDFPGDNGDFERTTSSALRFRPVSRERRLYRAGRSSPAFEGPRPRCLNTEDAVRLDRDVGVTERLLRRSEIFCDTQWRTRCKLPAK